MAQLRIPTLGTACRVDVQTRRMPIRIGPGHVLSPLMKRSGKITRLRNKSTATYRTVESTVNRSPRGSRQIYPDAEQPAYGPLKVFWLEVGGRTPAREALDGYDK